MPDCTCTCLGNAVLMVHGREKLIKYDIFRSWTGGRRVNGELYNGEIYYLWRNQAV